jgi:hypothetical protein
MFRTYVSTLLPAYVILRVEQVTKVDSPRPLPTRAPARLAGFGFAAWTGEVKILGLGMLS